MKLHVKKNDTVVVISGKDAGKTGEVLKVYPKTGKVLVAFLHFVQYNITFELYIAPSFSIIPP